MMKNKMFKAAAIFLSLLLLTASIGCSKKANENQGTSTPATTAEVTVTPEATEQPVAEVTPESTPGATVTTDGATGTPLPATATVTPSATTSKATATPKATGVAVKATTTPKASATPKGGSTSSKNLVNVALEKAGITTNNIDGAKGKEYRLTDGNKFDSSQWLGIGSGPRWIQVDLEKSYNVEKIHLWKFFGDDRTYHDEIIQLSNDPEFKTGVVTVFNNDKDNSSGQGAGKDEEYAQSADGKEFVFKAVNARYVRLWANGSTGNTINHFTELEVYAAAN